MLDLALMDLVRVSLTATKANYVSSLAITENAAGISLMITDEGAIAWSFAKQGGSWRISAMVITFASPKILTGRNVRGVPGLTAFFGR